MDRLCITLSSNNSSDLAWMNSAPFESYAAFVKCKQLTIQITSDKRFKRKMMERFEVFHYIQTEYLRRQSPYWAEKPPSRWMDMLRVELILAGNQVEDMNTCRLLWAASRGQRCPSVIRLPHRDTFSCEPGISDEQIPQMGFHERLCYLNYSYISHSCWKTCAEIQSSGFRLGCYWE